MLWPPGQRVRPSGPVSPPQKSPPPREPCLALHSPGCVKMVERPHTPPPHLHPQPPKLRLCLQGEAVCQKKRLLASTPERACGTRDCFSFSVKQCHGFTDTAPLHLHPQPPKLRLCLRGEAVCQKKRLLASTPERAGGTGGCFSFSVKQCRGFTDTALLHSPERQNGSRKSGPRPGASPSAAPAYRGRVNASRPGPGCVRQAAPGSSPVPRLGSRIPAPTPWAVTGCKGGKRPGAAHLIGVDAPHRPMQAAVKKRPFFLLFRLQPLSTSSPRWRCGRCSAECPSGPAASPARCPLR